MQGPLVTIALCAFVASTAAPARAQNFPPVADAAATPVQVFVGEPVALSSAASIDPDGSPAPLSFRWDFDDGTASQSPDPTHAFTTPRAHAVTLTVSDGADTAIDVVFVHVLARPLPERARHSSPIAIAPDGSRLWVANPDSHTVSELAVRSDGLVLVAERPVCRAPRTVAFDQARAAVLVACQGERALAVVDAAGAVSMIRVGAEPYGVVALPGGGALVSNQGDDTLTLLGPDLVPIATWATGDGPRAIAITADGARAYVSEYITRGTSGAVSVHDLGARVMLDTIRLADDPGPDTASSGRGVPNLLSALAIDPAGTRLWVGGLKSNTSAGAYRTGGIVAPVNWLRGVAAPIDLPAGAEVMARRIDTNDADSVSAIALSADGRYAYVAHQGAGALSIYDLSKATLFDPGAGTSVPFEARLDTGDAPQGVALSPDGRIAYVTNYLSRDVVAIDVSDPAAPRVVARVAVTAEPLAPAIANGKRLFYRSRGPVHSASNYVACASCHADGGGTDGRVWDFTQAGEGLRNTTDLRGRAGMAHGLVHWSANFDEIQDFENAIVSMFGGTGLLRDGAPANPPLGAPNAGRSGDLDDLAAYVSSLAYTPRSPTRAVDGARSDAAVRGEALFRDPALRCLECHPDPTYTISGGDASLVDVGTLAPGSGMRLGAPLAGIDVPTLVGLWDGAPYYHDGSAPTLRDVFRGRAETLEARLTEGLSDAQLADLVAFLLSLDVPEPGPRPEPEPAVDDPGCGCASSLPDPSLLLALALVLVRRRRSTPYEGAIA